MFYFLVTLGSGLILLGLLLRKREIIIDETDHALSATLSDAYARRGMDYENTELASDLNDRMEELEKTLFEQLLKWQVEKEALIEKLEVKIPERMEDHQDSAHAHEISKTVEGITAEEPAAHKNTPGENELPLMKPVPDNIRAVMEYEEQGLSVQEIAKVTRMKKGEVLLLRNLSKHYKK